MHAYQQKREFATNASIFPEGLDRFTPVIGKNSYWPPVADDQPRPPSSATPPRNGVARLGELLRLYWQIGRDILDRHERPNYRNGL
jgi:hypothetical protein